MGFDPASMGANIGKAFSPVATAGGAAGQSLGYGTVATGVNVAANISQGLGGLEQANFQSKVASGNASAALLSGQEQESASKMKYGGLEAKQVVSEAANGVQVRSGSAQAVVNSTEQVSQMDAALIHYNAARQAYGDQLQATVDKKAGQGALAKGVFGAGTSFLSGAQGLSDKWLQYQLSGAMTPAGG
jgi:hypothetical protein